MKLLIIFLFCLNIFQDENSVAQSITWQRSYGNTHINEGYSIVQTPDNGYIAVCRDRISIDEKAWVLRLNEYGDTLWTKIIMNDMPVKIIKTNDNNYLILGAFTDIIKININGDILWQKGPYGYSKIFRSVKQTIDGGYIICGWKITGNIVHPYLFKISSNGDSLWEQTFTNGIFDGRFTDLTISNDNNFVMTGNLSDTAYIWDKLFLMKTDNSGNIIWLRRYDTLEYYQTRTITNTIDNCLIVAGINGNINKPLFAKFDSSGSLIWLKIYNQSNLSFGELRSVITTENGYTFTGVWDTVGNFTFYVLLLNTDTSGNENWHRSFGFNNEDGGNEVKQTSDSGYVIIGKRGYYQNDDMYIIKTDKLGNSSPIGITSISNAYPVAFNLYQNYPNPFNPSTRIRFDIPNSSNVKLSIINILGEEITILVNEKLSAGIYEVEFNGRNLSSGIYFYRIESGDFAEAMKMVLIK